MIKQMLGNIGAHHRTEAALYIRTLLLFSATAPLHLTGWTLYDFAITDDDHWSRFKQDVGNKHIMDHEMSHFASAEVASRCLKHESRILACCRGLLNVASLGYNNKRAVDFTHRTVYDYFWEHSRTDFATDALHKEAVVRLIRAITANSYYRVVPLLHGVSCDELTSARSDEAIFCFHVIDELFQKLCESLHGLTGCPLIATCLWPELRGSIMPIYEIIKEFEARLAAMYPSMLQFWRVYDIHDIYNENSLDEGDFDYFLAHLALDFCFCSNELAQFTQNKLDKMLMYTASGLRPSRMSKRSDMIQILLCSGANPNATFRVFLFDNYEAKTGIGFGEFSAFSLCLTSVALKCCDLVVNIEPFLINGADLNSPITIVAIMSNHKEQLLLLFEVSLLSLMEDFPGGRRPRYMTCEQQREYENLGVILRRHEARKFMSCRLARRITFDRFGGVPG